MHTFFHVGFPKAASTMLQKHLFANHPEVINLGLYPLSNIGNDKLLLTEEDSNDIPYLYDERISSLYKMLSQPNGLVFNCEIAKTTWNEISMNYLGSDKVKATLSKVVLSHEAITSCRFANPETLEKARRLKDVFGEIKIILIIRNQLAMLKSLYRDHPFDPRTLELSPRPVSFAEWLDIDIERGALSLAKTLYFGRATAEFQSLFGKENVLVLPMEWLRSDLRLFSDQISKFLGINQKITYSLLDRPAINTGISSFGNQYRSIRGKLMPWAGCLRPFKKFLQPIDSSLFNFLKNAGPPSSVVIDSRHERFLYLMFADDNAKLAKSRNLPLGDLGYYL